MYVNYTSSMVALEVNTKLNRGYSGDTSLIYQCPILGTQYGAEITRMREIATFCPLRPGHASDLYQSFQVGNPYKNF